MEKAGLTEQNRDPGKAVYHNRQTSARRKVTLSSSEIPCTGPRTFSAFPYEPYPIQQGFMENLYATLETGGIGLFESPTGNVVTSECRHVLHVCQTAKRDSACLQALARPSA